MIAPILLLGANGQLGKALQSILGARAEPLTREQADLSQPQLLRKQLNAYQPSAVINAAAYTATDKAETERALAFAVNAESPGILAAFCAGRGIPFIHYSTDYVFDGSGNAPRTESEPTAPLNAYGESKRAGEEAVSAAGGQYLIFRTSWVFDAVSHNFVNTMLKLMREREELKVVADQHGAPTYAPHLAEASLIALEKLNPGLSGIYHLCNAGETTWHGFASAIRDEAEARGMPLTVRRILPVPSSEYPTPAKRPHNSRLDCSKALANFGIQLPDWRQALRDCLERKVG